jgi:hypothetical protein
MIGLFCFVLAVLALPFKSKSRLEAENAALRHQLIVLRRKMPGRPWLTNNDRWFFLQMYRWFPSILKVVRIIQPEALVCWHRAGFRGYWRWKSRRRGGRPQIAADLRTPIRRMSVENPLWGAPRIHGELLKLGFAVAQPSVAKYMAKRRVAHFPAQPCPRYCCDGPVCCPDHRLQPAVCLHHRAARSQRPRLDQRHDKPHRRMDRAPANRGISLGRSPALPHPRSGSNLWRYRHTPITRHGHPGQAYCTSLALADPLSRTVDRIDPARVC